MTDFFAQLHGFSLQTLILVSILAIKIVVAQFSSTQLLAPFTWYCSRLAQKVNKTQNTSQQQKIAGFIATMITIVPIFIMLWLFADFIAVPWLWQALLLYLAMGNFQLNNALNNIINALQKNQNHLAKQTLKPYVLRNVEPLSSMGINKTTIEMLLLRYVQQYFIISFYFLTFGALTALSVRLLLEMHYCWNKKQADFNSFGQFISQLNNILQWLPMRIFALLLLLSSIGKYFIKTASDFKKYFFTINSNLLISLFATILNIRLAGVAIYNESKLRRPSFNDNSPQPIVEDIIRAKKLIGQLLYFALTLTIIAAISTLLVY